MSKILRGSFLYFLVLCLSSSAVVAQEVVQINPNKVLTKKYIGNGVQWSAYQTMDIPDTAWRKTFERLDAMKVNFVRLMVSADDYCKTYPLKGKPIYAFDSDKMQRVYRILDYCQTHAVQVILGDWSDPSGGNKKVDTSKHILSFDGIQEYDSRWTAIVGELLQHLLQAKKYSCIRFYNLGNEPNGYWMHCASFDTWKQSIMNIDKELTARGLRKSIQIVGPDAAWGNDWIAKTIADKQLVNIIDAYEVHWYASLNNIVGGGYGRDMLYWRKYIDQNIPKGKDKQFFMGEAGMAYGKNDKDQQLLIGTFDYGVWMADYAIQSMNAGQAGLIAWDLDDAMHTSGHPGTGHTPGDYDWKIWGFWDSFGTVKGLVEKDSLRPWYYTWALLSRYFPKGANVLQLDSSKNAGLRYTAASLTGSKKGNDYSFVVVNESDTLHNINVEFPEVTAIAKIREFQYTKEHHPTNGKGFPVPSKIYGQLDTKNSIQLAVPAKSVILITTISS